MSDSVVSLNPTASFPASTAGGSGGDFSGPSARDTPWKKRRQRSKDKALKVTPPNQVLVFGPQASVFGFQITVSR